MASKIKFPKMDDEFIEAIYDIEADIEEEEFLIEHAVDLDFTTPTLLSHQSRLEALKEKKDRLMIVWLLLCAKHG